MKKNAWKWFILSIGYAGLIVYLSHQSNPIPYIKNFWNRDKLLHTIEYGMFGFLWVKSFLSINFLEHYAYQLTLIWGAIFAVSDEWHQSFIPGRNADVIDWIFDCLGIIIAIIIAKKIQKIKLV